MQLSLESSSVLDSVYWLNKCVRPYRWGYTQFRWDSAIRSFLNMLSHCDAVSYTEWRTGLIGIWHMGCTGLEHGKRCDRGWVIVRTTQHKCIVQFDLHTLRACQMARFLRGWSANLRVHCNIFVKKSLWMLISFSYSSIISVYAWICIHTHAQHTYTCKSMYEHMCACFVLLLSLFCSFLCWNRSVCFLSLLLMFRFLFKFASMAACSCVCACVFIGNMYAHYCMHWFKIILLINIHIYWNIKYRYYKNKKELQIMWALSW